MKKYKIFVAIVIIVVLNSCSSFLDEKPVDFLGPENFYQTEKDAAIGLNGIFSTLQAQAYYQRTVWLISELPGDFLQVALANAARQELEGYTYTDANAEIQNWWVNSYLMISRANDFLEKVPNIVMDDAKKNNLLGNARFLRGMAYFDLVRSFGDVPLLLTTIKGPQDNMKPARSPVADVYTQIIDDLTFAEANCVSEDKIAASEKGRISNGAASAMLGKVYLTRASTGAAQAGDYQSALNECNKVISSGLYKLQANYGDIFDPDKENWSASTAEHILDIQFDLAPNTGNITIQMQFPIESALIGGAGAGSFKVNPTFVNSYTAGDVRKAWNVSNQAGTKTLPIYFFYKYRDAKRVGNSSRINWPVLRYADVLLMQSEAINALTPGDVTKFTGINAVRNRAGIGALNLTNTPTSDAFVDALVRERAWELCLEGHRRFDLLRLGRLKQVQKAVYNRDIDDKYLLLPVPQTEMALDPNLAPNNPGF
jgi:hypothetical protein